MFWFKKEIMDIIKTFKKHQSEDLTERDKLVGKLLDKKVISNQEAILLLKSTIININTDEFTISSGAKIIGGSDFEVTKNER